MLTSSWDVSSLTRQDTAAVSCGNIWMLNMNKNKHLDHPLFEKFLTSIYSMYFVFSLKLVPISFYWPSQGFIVCNKRLSHFLVHFPFWICWIDRGEYTFIWSNEWKQNLNSSEIHPYVNWTMSIYCVLSISNCSILHLQK